LPDLPSICRQDGLFHRERTVIVDPFRDVRDLIRRRDRAALATVLPGDSGVWPYASLVLVAVDHDLSPILLMSDLAEHSKAIAADPRVALLFDGTAGLAQPLAGPRVTLMGRAAKTDDERLKRRFLRHHPDAAMYAGFGDFNFYKVSLERTHLVGGFGKIRWIEPGELLAVPALGELAESEEGIVAHMNGDHADAVQLYASKLLGVPGTGWTMTGIDAEGIDLRLQGEVARLPFEAPMTAAAQARPTLVALVDKARSS
jgi:heme oxygenase (biliverdin-IX-beta and delta-forming)